MLFENSVGFFLNYYLNKFMHLFQLVFFYDPPALNAGELYCDVIDMLQNFY